MTALRPVAELAIGALYAAGALFGIAYTLSHGDEFYGDFADGAWFPPARWLVREVVAPNATVFTVVLVVFEAAVAVIIFSRSSIVAAGLVAGAGFCIVAALASSLGGTIGNLALAAVQIALAVTR